jgi:hypothetical protein
VYKTKPIFVLESEWLKMTVLFDKSKKKLVSQEEPNPWITMESNKNDEEVRIFGSYTILVNSIFICIVTIIIVFMLGICLFNCMQYPPKFLQDYPFSSRSDSLPMVSCDPEKDPAIPHEEILTNTRESPVET